MRGFMIVGAMVMVAGTASAQTCVTRVVLDTSGLAHSRAYGVSADGRVVVGEATFHGGPLRAYRWTAEEGAKNLGAAGGTQSSASAVSADGRTVVGSTTTDATLARSPMRWTEETGMVALTPLRGGAVAVSADGSVVAGNYTNASGQSRVFRWTAQGGFQDVNIPTANDNYLRMVGMSADGSVIVGNRADPGGLVFRWTQATGAVAVAVTGGDWAEAFGVSPDGATIVGANYWSEWNIGHIAFKHTQTGTVNPSPVRTSNARRTSADGTYVVGDSHLSWGVDHAYRWDAAGGFIDLGTLGSNSRDSHATNVSADGSVVVGYARHPTLNGQLGVIWTIRDLGTDFNGDGFVDFFDYNRFVECFEGGACPAGRDADHNRDGFVDFFDYESYVTAFEEGC